MLTVCMKRDYFLDGVPGADVDERFTISFNGEISKFQYADVEFVFEEGGV